MELILFSIEIMDLELSVLYFSKSSTHLIFRFKISKSFKICNLYLLSVFKSLEKESRINLFSVKHSNNSLIFRFDFINKLL